MIDMELLKGLGMAFVCIAIISILPISLELKARKHYKNQAD